MVEVSIPHTITHIAKATRDTKAGQATKAPLGTFEIDVTIEATIRSPNSEYRFVEIVGITFTQGGFQIDMLDTDDAVMLLLGHTERRKLEQDFEFRNSVIQRAIDSGQIEIKQGDPNDEHRTR